MNLDETMPECKRAMVEGFNTYQKLAYSCAIYPDQGKNLYYPALGLAGETGEVCEKIKKIMRDKGGILTEEDREKIALEISDVLWYCSSIAKELKVDLGDIAVKNIEKLFSRKERGALKGNGDNR